MRNVRNVALGLVGAAAVASASDVHDLKKDTFTDFVKSHSLVLAEFFAPWCGHCKALAPEYEEAATTLKEKDIPLVKIDCVEEAELCKEYGVEGYPTVKVFRGPDNASPYQGQRKAPAIISYMTKQALPAVSNLTSETFEEFKTADQVVVVAFFEAGDKTSNTTFSEVAESMRDDHLFGASNDAKLAEAEGVKFPSVVLYKSFDEGKNIFEEKFEKEAITKFTKTSAMPLVGEVGPETYAGYMAAGIPLAYIFAETPEERAELAAELKPLAEKHKGVISFATIDAKAFGAHAGNLNLEDGKWPAFAIQETVKNQKFPFDQAKKLTHDDVGAFVQDFVDGKVDPSIKSEPIPEKQEGPVQTVVALNYKDIVLDNEKDVLLEFYAPWCGHCKALAPKFEELASMYPAGGKVTVAKVDATVNDVPDEIQGFPTIKLFPAGGKEEPITYSGSRTIEDLAEFIKENGKYKVDAFDGKNETADDTEAPLAEGMGEAAKAATETAKSVASDAAEAVKTAVTDTDGTDDGSEHDEL
ncbi:MAG: protein disulfide-isomerase precursor [Alectoria fallacina]|uniref:Protein disulfide-isomerase n=1 Tax=Alectoria fallacina TaxID=1903189 RepID=A0A8H3FZ57_9LECA|nr:MAG: protein disulfide-isomerase precursor [Alectoria fallacina]